MPVLELCNDPKCYDSEHYVFTKIIHLRKHFNNTIKLAAAIKSYKKT